MRSLLAVALVAVAAAGQELSDAQAQRFLRHVVPQESELRWRSIPWRASLWEGVVEAHGAKKPVLLWAMNGHPLACT